MILINSWVLVLQLGNIPLRTYEEINSKELKSVYFCGWAMENTGMTNQVIIIKILISFNIYHNNI